MKTKIKKLKRKIDGFFAQYFGKKFTFRLAYLNGDKLEPAELMVMGPKIRKKAEDLELNVELEEERGIIICKGRGKYDEVEEFLSYLWEEVGLAVIT